MEETPLPLSLVCAAELARPLLGSPLLLPLLLQQLLRLPLLPLYACLLLWFAC
jgi:hypothetical protein